MEETFRGRLVVGFWLDSVRRRVYRCVRHSPKIIEIFDRYDVPSDAADEIRDVIQGTGRAVGAAKAKELEPAA